MAVLRSVLMAFQEIDEAGTIVHLPFEWPESAKEAGQDEFEPPPITVYLKKNIRQVMKFIKRDIPPEFLV